MRLVNADAYKSEMKTRQDACEEWRDEAKAYGNEEQYARAEEALATFIEAKLTLDKMPTIEVEPFTDKEQRIFLAAMAREEKVCKEVDEECRDCREPYEDSLVKTCHEITRKVKSVLWT